MIPLRIDFTEHDHFNSKTNIDLVHESGLFVFAIVNVNRVIASIQYRKLIAGPPIHSRVQW